MFDLFRSRAKAVRYLLGAVLLLVALSMVITLIPGFGSGPMGNESVVARIGKEPLTTRDVQQAIQNIQRRGNVPPDMIQHFVPEIVDQMITERAMAYEAQRLGMRVTDADLAQAIRTLLPQLFQGDQFAGKEAYAAMLAQQNLSIEQFESSLARQVLIDRLRSIALQGIVVSPQDVERAYRDRGEKAKIEYVMLSPEKFRSQVQVTPEQEREQYNRAKSTYRIPEKRSLDLLVLDQAKLEASITVPDADLQKAYDAEKERFRVPERVQVRHILLSTVGKSKEEEAKIHAQAESLLKQLRGGADFAKMAEKYSDDPGSKGKGGDLGWVVRQQTVPEFEQAAFSLKPMQISDLVKTQYGYHIIQVLAKEPAHLRAFDEVKGEIAGELKRQRVTERMQSLADTAEAELRKNPAHPEQVASSLGLQYSKVDQIAPGDPIPEVGANQEFSDVVFGAKQGDITQPVAVGTTKFVIGVVTKIFPAHEADFAEVEKQIHDQLVTQKAGEQVSQKADALAAKAKEMNGDLRKAAQSLGLDVKTSDEFTRAGAIEGLGSANLIGDAFTKPVGAVVGPVTVAGGRTVYKVLGHTPADMSQFAAQRDSIRDELKGGKARDWNRLFEDSVKNGLMDQGKIKIYQDAVQRLMASYRS